MTELKRIVSDLRSGELVLRVLYSTQDGPGPATKARRREVSNLVRTGLQDALEVLEGGRVDMVGTSGYTAREDVLCITNGAEGVSSVHKKLKKGA
ncbi:MAG TPA: hypothetical protein VFI90_04205 [Rubrobacter sp.]|nr:hypothetical protein [Rubrobacter sp.]